MFDCEQASLSLSLPVTVRDLVALAQMFVDVQEIASLYQVHPHSLTIHIDTLCLVTLLTYRPKFAFDSPSLRVAYASISALYGV